METDSGSRRHLVTSVTMHAYLYCVGVHPYTYMCSLTHQARYSSVSVHVFLSHWVMKYVLNSTTTAAPIQKVLRTVEFSEQCS